MSLKPQWRKELKEHFFFGLEVPCPFESHVRHQASFWINGREQGLLRWTGLDLRQALVEHGPVTKLEHPWSERNKDPILEVFRQVLPTSGTVLEIGSGSGQHASFFSEALPNLEWLPSDIEDENLESIRAWRADSGRTNFLAPIRLDVCSDPWPVDRIDVVFSANMIHIAPWECCLGLLAGARRHLERNGLLLMYGPFRIGGEQTAESNTIFDANLRDRDPAFGIRDLEAIRDAARGLALEERLEMPANNFTLAFRKA